MSTLVDWFDALGTGEQWALVCGVSFGLMLLGIGLSLARPVKDESGWASSAWASELELEPEPVVPKRSPFAPKQRAVSE